MAGVAGLPGPKLNDDSGRNHYFCELVQNAGIILLIWSTRKSMGNYRLFVVDFLILLAARILLSVFSFVVHRKTLSQSFWWQEQLDCLVLN
jgi:hypothetical protein